MANRGFWRDGAVWFSADNLNAMLLQYGATEDRPDFGQRGRVFFDTTTGVESYDDGGGWNDKQWGTDAYRDDSVTNDKITGIHPSKLTAHLTGIQVAVPLAMLSDPPSTYFDYSQISGASVTTFNSSGTWTRPSSTKCVGGS